MKEMQSADLSGPLKGLRPYNALLGLTQASGFAGGFDFRLSQMDESGAGGATGSRWIYDTKNNPASQTQTINGTVYTTNYTYDNDNRLTGSAQSTQQQTITSMHLK